MLRPLVPPLTPSLCVCVCVCVCVRARASACACVGACIEDAHMPTCTHAHRDMHVPWTPTLPQSHLQHPHLGRPKPLAYEPTPGTTRVLLRTPAGRERGRDAGRGRKERELRVKGQSKNERESARARERERERGRGVEGGVEGGRKGRMEGEREARREGGRERRH